MAPPALRRRNDTPIRNCGSIKPLTTGSAGIDLKEPKAIVYLTVTWASNSQALIRFEGDGYLSPSHPRSQKARPTHTGRAFCFFF